MKRLVFGIWIWVLASFAWGQEVVPLMLSPMEQEKLRAQHQALRAGLPVPDVTNTLRLTAALVGSTYRTQTLALSTVTIVTRNKASVMVRENGVFIEYLPSDRPAVISVITNTFDFLNAPEVAPVPHSAFRTPHLK